jgi:hypothetical protein
MSNGLLHQNISFKMFERYEKGALILIICQQRRRELPIEVPMPFLLKLWKEIKYYEKLLLEMSSFLSQTLYVTKEILYLLSRFRMVHL